MKKSRLSFLSAWEGLAFADLFLFAKGSLFLLHSSHLNLSNKSASRHAGFNVIFVTSTSFDGFTSSSLMNSPFHDCKDGQHCSRSHTDFPAAMKRFIETSRINNSWQLFPDGQVDQSIWWQQALQFLHQMQWCQEKKVCWRIDCAEASPLPDNDSISRVLRDLWWSIKWCHMEAVHTRMVESAQHQWLMTDHCDNTAPQWVSFPFDKIGNERMLGTHQTKKVNPESWRLKNTWNVTSPDLCHLDLLSDSWMNFLHQESSNLQCKLTEAFLKFHGNAKLLVWMMHHFAGSSTCTVKFQTVVWSDTIMEEIKCLEWFFFKWLRITPVVQHLTSLLCNDIHKQSCQITTCTCCCLPIFLLEKQIHFFKKADLVPHASMTWMKDETIACCRPQKWALPMCMHGVALTNDVHEGKFFSHNTLIKTVTLVFFSFLSSHCVSHKKNQPVSNARNKKMPSRKSRSKSQASSC